MPRLKIDPKFKCYDKPPVKHAGGRPTAYTSSHAKQVFNLALLGATDEQMADALEITVPTFYAWQKINTEFFKALQDGKVRADALVARSLFKRAVGFKHKSVKIFLPKGGTTEADVVYAPYEEYHAPDTGAAKSWLANRQRGKWTERVEVGGIDGQAIAVAMTHTIDPQEAAKSYSKAMGQG